MHDIDSTRTEFEQDQENPPAQAMGSGVPPGTRGPGLSEAEEEALAAELLGVGNEAELDNFLDGLFNKLSGAISGAAKFLTHNGGPLGGVLKGIAGKALPLLGGALGTAIPIPGVGTALGTALGNAAGQLLQSETGELEPEEQEFERARRFVRLATQTVRHGVRHPYSSNPVATVHNALRSAVRDWRQPYQYRQYPGDQRYRYQQYPRYQQYTGYQQYPRYQQSTGYQQYPRYQQYSYYQNYYPYHGYRRHHRHHRYYYPSGDPNYGSDWQPAPAAWPDVEPVAPMMPVPDDAADMVDGAVVAPPVPEPPPAAPVPVATSTPTAGTTANAGTDTAGGTEFENAYEGEEEGYDTIDATPGIPGMECHHTGRWVRHGRKIVLYGF